MDKKEIPIATETSDTLLFSVNTNLAFLIAEKYYCKVHYAWFTTQFDFGNKQPASSNPRSICHDILEAIATNDHHCEKLERIKGGILKGAYAKLKEGIIDQKQELEIRSLVSRADEEVELMMPVLFLATWNRASKYCEKKWPGETASPDSIEYLSRELPRSAFEIIDMKKVLANIDCFERRRF